MANNYPGLFIGTIGFRSNSVVNSVAGAPIPMGSAVQLVAGPSNELLPRVEPVDKVGALMFGIAVQGDADGIYGDVTTPIFDINRAALRAGQGVGICTKGRCIARVNGAVSIGDALMTAVVPPGVLIPFVPASGNNKVAIVLVAQAGDGLTAVDVQREGLG